MPRRSARSSTTPPSRHRSRRTGLASRLVGMGACFAERAAALSGRTGAAVTEGFDRLLPPGSPRRRRTERAGISAFAIILLAGAIWGVPSLERRADELSREAPVPNVGPEVVFADDLAWLPIAERERLAATVSASLADRSVTDHRALSAAAEALEATGWFEGPPRLRRIARHLVEVEAPWRLAAALVRDRDTDHLVDASGRRLPLAWPTGSGPSDLVVVEGLSEPAPNRPGDPWPGGSLGIALRVLPDLAGHAWSDQIAIVDATAIAHGGPIALETVRGGRLIWGRPDAGAAEVPVATRLAWLDALHAGNGSIDPPPARQFDLRLDYLASAPRRVAVR